MASVLRLELRAVLAPQPRKAPDAAAFSEGKHCCHNHQKREGAKRDKPPSRMAGLVRIRRFDPVVCTRGLFEREMDEEKHPVHSARARRCLKSSLGGRAGARPGARSGTRPMRGSPPPRSMTSRRKSDRGMRAPPKAASTRAPPHATDRSSGSPQVSFGLRRPNMEAGRIELPSAGVPTERLQA